ncbi:unnamed protein product, partial [Discosporangium mesarthrocarpum]
GGHRTAGKRKERTATEDLVKKTHKTLHRGQLRRARANEAAYCQKKGQEEAVCDRYQNVEKPMKEVPERELGSCEVIRSAKYFVPPLRDGCTSRHTPTSPLVLVHARWYKVVR